MNSSGCVGAILPTCHQPTSSLMGCGPSVGASTIHRNPAVSTLMALQRQRIQQRKATKAIMPGTSSAPGKLKSTAQGFAFYTQLL
ncbi:unnamed protein product [Nippostrongylus brasiliensis]|uniref:Uncharacterized protein n=1 Tax=Nippostrongylus brasiliensis TaxID=27835 RepID=A0A0N4YGW2_NIPBR|nr:unnamed protein product [Nippostrongylus brasiliensis]